jgi:2-polyprenyl-3-methyl-5-hydroxy-6-metoxy-1,4-benzoquinol methylase
MALRVDPEQIEIQALKGVTDWRGKRVLEVGCGDGRLTKRLAQLGAIIYANDPNAGLIARARKNLPQRFANKVSYKVGRTERLAHASEAFDIVVFSWLL